jgi:hypothetical protein
VMRERESDAMREHRDFNLLKATHKAIYSQNWPKYAAVELYKPARSLRSSITAKNRFLISRKKKLVSRIIFLKQEFFY